MNKKDYIAQVDRIEFSPDLEQKLLDGLSLAKPKKKHFAIPFSAVAACILLVISIIAIPTLKTANMTDGATAETQDLKDKTTTYVTYSGNALADTVGGTTEDAKSSSVLLLNMLTLNYDNGDPISKDEYEAECERLQELGYDAVMAEHNGAPCINIAIHPYEMENFTDTKYNYNFTNITE